MHQEYIYSFLFHFYQAMSPDGEAIVTGAGDETLRFWNVFSKMRSTKVRKHISLSLLSPRQPAEESYVFFFSFCFRSLYQF